MDGHDSLIAGRVGSYVLMEGNYKTYFSLCTCVRTKNPLEGGLKMHEGGFLCTYGGKLQNILSLCAFVRTKPPLERGLKCMRDIA